MNDSSSSSCSIRCNCGIEAPVNLFASVSRVEMKEDKKRVECPYCDMISDSKQEKMKHPKEKHPVKLYSLRVSHPGRAD